MGCDIHIYVEKKVKNEWENGDVFVKNKYFGIDETEPEYKVNEIHSTRNYNLFALLANVRNYGGIDPISRPRGLPGDVSVFVKNKSDSYGSDGHSHSYLNLFEIKKFSENELLKDIITKLEYRQKDLKIYGENADSNIRIVFWFDN